MSIQITINGDNAGEALKELRDLATGLFRPMGAIEAVAQTVAEARAATAPAAEAAASEASETATDKPKRTRRTKAEIEAEKAAEAQAANASAPEVQAQDAADEKAEVEANRKPEKPLTREDVKAVMAKYVEAYGMAATQEDGPKIFREALGEPPAGEAYWKLSILPEDSQDAMAKTVAVWTRALQENPLKREKVAA